MAAFKVTLAYDGTDLVGWQRQASGRSVQGLLEDALARLEGAPVQAVGAGRTDAGVHASAQVASVQLARDIEAATLGRALNATLPPDVRVRQVELVLEDFNARFDAKTKTYGYRIATDAVLSPFLRRFVWHVPEPLDTAVMSRSALVLEGRHDFAAFRSTGSEVSSTVREIYRSRLRETGAEGRRELVYEVTGNGFLRHMVRAIVGTLVDLGAGRHDLAPMGEILGSRDRRRAGRTAPPEGLCLMDVGYEAVSRSGAAILVPGGGTQ